MVVQTHQYMELEARAQLSKQGYDVAMPLMRLPRNRLGVRRVVPLFEGYAFVKETDAWWAIRGTPGVSHVIMNCGRPSLIADDEIRFFTDVSVDELGYYADPVMSVHRVGDVVTPVRGRLRGVSVKLTELDADGRCAYLFSMMGREVRVKGRVTELA